MNRERLKSAPISERKENRKKPAEKKLFPPSENRIPLVDLSENVLKNTKNLNIRKFCKSVEVVRTKNEKSNEVATTVKVSRQSSNFSRHTNENGTVTNLNRDFFEDKKRYITPLPEKENTNQNSKKTTLKTPNEGVTNLNEAFIESDKENSKKATLKTRISRPGPTIRSSRSAEVLLHKAEKPEEEEKEIRYCYKSENVTERLKESEIIPSFDEVFVEGETHFLTYVTDREINQISKKPRLEEEITRPLPVVGSTRSSIQKDEIKKPAHKFTLARKRSSKRKQCGEDELFQNCLYDLEYVEENYCYMLQQERNFVYRKDYLCKYTDDSYRMIVVNWLIYVQQLLDLAEPTFFMGIRMFDYVILATKLPPSKYLLVGITCMWIANKQIDVHYIRVTKLFSLCNGKFSRYEIISAERRILQILKFNTNFPEPTTFLYYYLTRQNMKNDPKIRHSAMFLLEVFTLLLDFSSLCPSLLACIALHLVLVKYDLDTTWFVNYVHHHLLDKEIFLRKSEKMGRSVPQLLAVTSISNEVVGKYLKEEKSSVAEYFVPK